DEALEFVREDEAVETTPLAVRMRKVVLSKVERLKTARQLRTEEAAEQPRWAWPIARRDERRAPRRGGRAELLGLRRRDSCAAGRPPRRARHGDLRRRIGGGVPGADG